MRNVSFLLFLLLTIGVSPVWAQRMVLSGQVTEATTGQPVPFASLFLPGTSAGVTADAEGRYELATTQRVDSLAASAIGYKVQKKRIGAEFQQTINFALSTSGVTLGEVTVRPTENPAYEILRRVQTHKPKNDKRYLEAFAFDSYNRVDVAVNDLPKGVARSRVLRQMTAVADSLGQARTADGKQVLPLFASEVLSRYFVRRDPRRKREEIKRTQMRGLAPRNGSVLSQILGSSFQDWDFYPNWQQLLGKDFISPIADGWKFTYEYELQDSVYLGKDWCYKLAVTPRRPQDLAFTGTIWITANSYALRRVDLAVSPEANLNFVSKIQVYQDLAPTVAGPWLPTRTRVYIAIKPGGVQVAGVTAKFTTVNQNFDINNPQPLPFYDRPVVAAPDAYDAPDDFWEKNRPDTLSVDDQRTLAILDSVQNLPSVQSLKKVADVFVNGYKRVGMVDLGPIWTLYGFNNIEGSRFRVGFRTTPEFSREWLMRAYLAYGTRDTRLKYDLRISRILNRDNWTVITAERRHDLDQLALIDNDYALENPLFEAAARLGNITSSRPLMRNLNMLSVQSDLFRGFTQRVTVRQQNFDPLYPFAYYTDEPVPGAPLADQFSLSELVLESRYARDEVLVQSRNQNQRYAIGLKKWPVFTLRYTLGLDKFLSSDFKYQKFTFQVSQSVRLGQLGRTDYIVDAGYIPSTVPYLILKTHLGNQSPFYNAGAFNLMRYSEFVSDKYASFQFENHFEGFLVNSVPALKQLNWRLVATGSILYGGVSAANRAITPAVSSNGEPLFTFQSLGRLPYAEVGYGVENIFKVARVDFLHRLTYRNSPGAKDFGVKVSLQFKL
ncbi:DUF5686 and carboxypeptidase-like regulatory domain-containing protein [Hymenobacter crusticola]|uniref:Carboxypeptidase-like regulatory domain-containing protein n=1 Tax=Hymenobacter crusticola TaxID=1770526 RepID=A0A243WKN9_9BACT|nr:DUF5686 and carboxypeptidase-like regulatory domain-containing protein [Hymenobacter crusticola]OUJ76170.1 hypothetical protein BXP70_02555 [Hymenobacter crusticola]